MLRALYSAVSGLQAHQTKLDIIGNNIANVNTTGFKKSRANFVSMLDQTLKGATPAPSSGKLGDATAIQVGLGVSLGSTERIMTQGSAQTTGNPTDLMLQGEGLFVLNDNGTTVYTRAGALGFDSNGNLVDPSTGAKVQGYTFSSTNQGSATWPTSASTTLPTGYGDIKFNIGDYLSGTSGPQLTRFSIGQDGVITGVYTDSSTGASQISKIAQIAVSKIPNEAGMTNIGNSYFVPSASSGQAVVDGAGVGGRGMIVSGALEMSNVDLSSEFTDMITAQRGFQANARVITVADSVLQEVVDLKRQ